MPNLNLKDDEIVHEEPMAPRLRRRDEGSQSKGAIIVLYIVLILVVLGAAAFFLDRAGIIKLWGSKPAVVKRVAPPTPSVDSLAAAEAAKVEALKAGAAKDTEKKTGAVKTATASKKKSTMAEKAAMPPAHPAASGEYAVQLSSWPEEEKATAHADQLKESGLDAYVVKVDVKGGTRWTVRVGRFTSQQEAKDEAARLGETAENKVIVVKAQ